MSLFIGIDLAFAKRKRLPVCVCERRDGRLIPLPLPPEILSGTPRGRGNRAALNAEVLLSFAEETAQYLASMEKHFARKVKRIAIDAPRTPAEPNQRRQAELAMDRLGISCIATPTKSGFEEIRARANKHLQAGKPEARLPGANQIWMLVGFELFRILNKRWDCIEVYPQATMHRLGASSRHKRHKEGVQTQFEALRRFTNWPNKEQTDGLLRLRKIVSAPTHDAVDAYASAWIAALDQTSCEALGSLPLDVIWVPGRSLIDSPAEPVDHVILNEEG